MNKREIKLTEIYASVMNIKSATNVVASILVSKGIDTPKANQCISRILHACDNIDEAIKSLEEEVIN